jgi:hypothetical protein
MNLKDKINMRMDELEHMMDSNHHLKDAEAVSNHISSISKFWSILSEEDKDYIEGARYSIEKGTVWNENS